MKKVHVVKTTSFNESVYTLKQWQASKGQTLNGEWKARLHTPVGREVGRYFAKIRKARKKGLAGIKELQSSLR